jgi:DNA-binding beta-propeller fold protein YncE
VFAGSPINNSGSKDGVGTNANFINPEGLAVNPLGTALYVSDYSISLISSIALSSGDILLD